MAWLGVSLELVVALALGGVVFGCGSGAPSNGSGGAGGAPGGGGAGGAVAGGVAVTAVGAPRGAKVEAMIPVQGGTLASADGRLRIDVPPDALAAPQTLSVQAIGNEAPGGRGQAYRLGPEGTTFAAPVKLTFNIGDADVAGSEPEALGVAFQDAMKRWNWLKAAVRDDAAKTIAVETTHFSDWTVLTGWQLVPWASMVMAGASRTLTIEVCGKDVPGNDELQELVTQCQPDTGTFTVDQWTVNGVVGGDATVGHIAATGANAGTYAAPAAVPPKNPVIVSVSATDKSGRKTLLSATIYVNAHAPFMGTVSSRQVDDGIGLVVTTNATVTFAYDEMKMMYLVAPGSLLDAKRDIVSNGCESHASTPMPMGLPAGMPLAPMDGSILFLELGYFPTGAAQVTFTGTSSCMGSAPEAFTVTEQIEWWPNDIASILSAGPNFELKGGYIDQLLASGATVSAEWSLAPVAKP